MKFEASTLKDFYLKWTKYEPDYKLGKSSESEYSLEIPEYIITCVSENPGEKYDIYYNTL